MGSYMNAQGKSPAAAVSMPSSTTYDKSMVLLENTCRGKNSKILTNNHRHFRAWRPNVLRNDDSAEAKYWLKTKHGQNTHNRSTRDIILGSARSMPALKAFKHVVQANQCRPKGSLRKCPNLCYYLGPLVNYQQRNRWPG